MSGVLESISSCASTILAANSHFRGLKDGLRSVHEYITSVREPAKELCLYTA
jgi:hypothetical protein